MRIYNIWFCGEIRKNFLQIPPLICQNIQIHGYRDTPRSKEYLHGMSGSDTARGLNNNTKRVTISMSSSMHVGLTKIFIHLSVCAFFFFF